MGIERRFLVAAGSLLITSVCPALAPAGTLLDTLLKNEVVEKLLDAIASVAGSNAANAVEGMLPPGRSGDDGRLLENADLTKAVGKAIAVVIWATAKKSFQGKTDIENALKRLAKHAQGNWVKLAQKDFAPYRYKQLMEVNLADVITPTKKHTTQEAWLTVALWQDICKKLSQQISNHYLPLKVFEVVANELYTLFPKALREVLKRDFAEKGEAFAGLSLSLLTEMRKKLSDLQKSHHDETTLILKHFAAVERHLRGDKAEQRSFFQALSQRIDSGFEAVIQNLGLMQITFDQIINDLGRIESSLNTVVQNTEENLEFSRATLEFSSATYEMLRSKTLPNSIWRCLLLFDYENQQREFDRFIQDNSVGACLV
ncbi:MAG: hypothetical protein EA366_14390, partial [Spirulina sp. DLM2.Bin59]